MFVIRVNRMVRGRSISSYLHRTGDTAILSAKHLATKFDTFEKAESGTCYIQELEQYYGYINCEIEEV